MAVCLRPLPAPDATQTFEPSQREDAAEVSVSAQWPGGDTGVKLKQGKLLMGGKRMEVSPGDFFCVWEKKPKLRRWEQVVGQLYG